MGRFLLVLPIVLLLPLYVVFHQGVWESRAQVRQSTPPGFLIPSQFSRVLAFGYKGVLSDYLFLKALTFYGGRGQNDQVLTEEDWQYFIACLDVVTDLDPYFFDPYILAEGVLTWDAGRYVDANRLLEKGRRYRTSDWRIPYFISFNYFYFLKDYAKGGEYMMEAARLPGSPAYLPNLAARVAYYGDQTKTALFFLKQMLADTKDPVMLVSMQTRLAALEQTVLLEDLVKKFRTEQGRDLVHLDELVSFGYLGKLPPEPYGGQWVMNKAGRIFSTSKFAKTPAQGSASPQ